MFHLSDFDVLIFDADDTLWLNERYYREAESKFVELMSSYTHRDRALEIFKSSNVNNLSLYGFGGAAMVLSMMQVVMDLLPEAVPTSVISSIFDLLHSIIRSPVELIPGVESTLKHFKDRGCRLVIATKGCLVDQERKVKASGLTDFFDHVEVLSDKQPDNYARLFKKLGVQPERVLMVGNSMKSDVLPVIGMGGTGVFIPADVSWDHEHAEAPANCSRLLQLKSISELTDALA